MSLNAWWTAIDVVKTRIQVDPSMARLSLLSGGRRIVAQEGSAALLTGFGPTAVGYLVQVRNKLHIAYLLSQYEDGTCC